MTVWQPDAATHGFQMLALLIAVSWITVAARSWLAWILAFDTPVDSTIESQKGIQLRSGKGNALPDPKDYDFFFLIGNEYFPDGPRWSNGEVWVDQSYWS